MCNNNLLQEAESRVALHKYGNLQYCMNIIFQT